MTAVARYPTAWAAVVDYLERLGTGVLFGLHVDELVLLAAIDPRSTSMVFCRI